MWSVVWRRGKTQMFSECGVGGDKLRQFNSYSSCSPASIATCIVTMIIFCTARVMRGEILISVWLNLLQKHQLFERHPIRKEFLLMQSCSWESQGPTHMAWFDAMHAQHRRRSHQLCVCFYLRVFLQRCYRSTVSFPGVSTMGAIGAADT